MSIHHATDHVISHEMHEYRYENFKGDGKGDVVEYAKTETCMRLDVSKGGENRLVARFVVLRSCESYMSTRQPPRTTACQSVN